MSEGANDRLIRFLRGDTSMLCCTVCNTAGPCDCWTRCWCGWSFRKGGNCRNPAHLPAPPKEG